jgi:hypothetical protein
MRLHRAFALAGVCFLAAGAVRAQDLVIRTWLVRGPIPVDTGAMRLLRDYAGGETGLLPDSGDVASGGAFLPAAADSLGRVNLVALLRTGTDHAVAYLHAYVFVPADRTLLLVMDSDDDLVAFVNGQRVWVHSIARGVGRGRDTTTVRFAAGWNSVLLKPVNRTGGFDALGRIAAIAGAIPGASPDRSAPWCAQLPGGHRDGVPARPRRPPHLDRRPVRPRRDGDGHGVGQGHPARCERPVRAERHDLVRRFRRQPRPGRTDPRPAPPHL